MFIRRLSELRQFLVSWAMIGHLLYVFELPHLRVMVGKFLKLSHSDGLRSIISGLKSRLTATLFLRNFIRRRLTLISLYFVSVSVHAFSFAMQCGAR
jgi:hypothetical protein